MINDQWSLVNGALWGVPGSGSDLVWLSRQAPSSWLPPSPGRECCGRTRSGSSGKIEIFFASEESLKYFPHLFRSFGWRCAGPRARLYRRFSLVFLLLLIFIQRPESWFLKFIINWKSVRNLSIIMSRYDGALDKCENFLLDIKIKNYWDLRTTKGRYPKARLNWGRKQTKWI